MCCWAILANGERVLIHIDLAGIEKYETWKVFLEDLVRRGSPSLSPPMAIPDLSVPWKRSGV
jgi:hypothetical protein